MRLPPNPGHVRPAAGRKPATASVPWNPAFETVLRQGLPGPAKAALAPPADKPLEVYGLDSLPLTGIVSALEAAFGVRLSGQVVVPVRTLTAGQLWGIVSAALQPGPAPSARPASHRAAQAPSPRAIA